MPSVDVVGASVPVVTSVGRLPSTLWLVAAATAAWVRSAVMVVLPLDPQRGPSSGSARVSRGGCWLIVARYCRSSFRYYDSPGYRYISLGFRLLRIVPQRWALLHSYPVNHDVSNGGRQAAKAGAGTPEPSGEPPASGWAIFPGESVMLAL